MSSETQLADRLAELEARLQALEDEQEITRLIARYGPLVDAGAAEEVAALWTEDGAYDVDEADLRGHDQLVAMVGSRSHQGFIEAGCAHVLGPVAVSVTGDRAVAVCHSLMVVNTGGSFEVDASFVVRRATAHHWDLVRTPAGWRAAVRTSRVLDGREEARALLAHGARGEGAGLR